MSVSPSNPHDAYFRQVLGRPADAAAELRAVLPEAIAARLDWSRLVLRSGSFVSVSVQEAPFRVTAICCSGPGSMVTTRG